MDKREAAAKRLKERQAAAKKRFKLPEGDTFFRVLPNTAGDDELEYYEYAMHSNVGPRKAYVRCGKNMKNKGKCWLCDTMLPKLVASGKSSKKDAADSMGRKECFAVQIATTDEDSKEWLGPFIWEMSPSVANQLLTEMSSTKKRIFDPEKGYNLKINRVGTGRTDTRYGTMRKVDESSEVPSEIISRLKGPEEIAKEYDEEAMKAAYYGHEQDEEPEEDEEDKPSRKDDDDEDDEKPSKKDDDDEDNVDEDDDEPKGKKSSKDDDEDEDEPKPKKGKKKDDDEEDGESEDDDVTEALEDDDEESSKDEDDEDEPKSKKGKKSSKDDDEDEDEEPKQKKGKKKSRDEDDDD